MGEHVGVRHCLHYIRTHDFECHTNTVIFDSVVSFTNTRCDTSIHNVSSAVIPQDRKPNTPKEENIKAELNVSSYIMEVLSLYS